MAVTVNSGGVKYTSSSRTPYVDIYKNWNKNQQAQIKTYQQNQNKQLSSDINKLNGAYDSNARQYYIQNMQSQKGLNSQLAAQGINGGASESAMLRMNNAYGQNIAKNETGRQSDITSTRNAYETAMNDYLAQRESDRANMYTTMMQNQAEYDEKQKDKDLQNYAASIADRFNSDKAWQKYIKSLKANKGLTNHKQKVALAQQAYTRWKMNQQEKASSGGGGGYSRSGYGGYGGYGSYNNNGDDTVTSPELDNATKKVSKTTKAIAKQVKKRTTKKTNSSKNKHSYGQYHTTSWY